jgi:hypothetical protein
MQKDKKHCAVCCTELVFKSELGAPGKGYSYDCPKCHTSHWVYGSIVQPFKNLNAEDVTLTIADVI